METFMAITFSESPKKIPRQDERKTEEQFAWQCQAILQKMSISGRASNGSIFCEAKINATGTFEWTRCGKTSQFEQVMSQCCTRPYHANKETVSSHQNTALSSANFCLARYRLLSHMGTIFRLSASHFFLSLWPVNWNPARPYIFHINDGNGQV